MERSKESRQQPPVMEECRLPMLGEEQEDLSLSHLMTRQGWLNWKAMTKNENLCQYFVRVFLFAKYLTNISCTATHPEMHTYSIDSMPSLSLFQMNLKIKSNFPTKRPIALKKEQKNS